MRRQSSLGVLSGFIVALVLLVAACERNSARPPTPPSVYISTPAWKVVTGWDNYIGHFEAIDTVELRPRVSGYIDLVLFHDGEVVQKGTILFEIDPRPYEADVNQMEGRLAQARSELALASEELARAEALIISQTIAASLFDQRREAQRAAQAALKATHDAVVRARRNLEFTRVRAPMTGRISRTLVSAGNLVTGGDSGGTLLTTIVTLDPIEIYFDIDEQSFLRYSNTAAAHKRTFWNTLGAPVRVELQGDDSPIRTGTLDFLDNRLDPSTGTLRARARVQNPDLSLSPGEFGRVFIIGEPAHRALLVPDEAVTNDATRLVLKIIGSDDRVSLRPVTLGRKFGDLREISSGLGSEDRVIVSGLQGAQPGDPVIPQSRPLAGQHLATLGVER